LVVRASTVLSSLLILIMLGGASFKTDPIRELRVAVAMSRRQSSVCRVRRGEGVVSEAQVVFLEDGGGKCYAPGWAQGGLT
jgi:hypothetical protein